MNKNKNGKQRNSRRSKNGRRQRGRSDVVTGPVRNFGNRVYPFRRSVTFIQPITQSGFLFGGASIPDCNFDVSLAFLNVYANGAFQTSVAIPGTSDLSSLFQEWRVNNIDASYSVSFDMVQNTPPPTAPTLALPMIFQAVDTSTDFKNAQTVATVSQYQDFTFSVLGAARGNGFITRRFKPVTLFSATSGIMLSASEYISTQTPNQEFGAIIHVLDSPLASSVNTIAYVYFVFNIDYDCRHPI